MKREAEEGKIMRMKETNVRIDGKKSFGGKRKGRKYESEGDREDDEENKREKT